MLPWLPLPAASSHDADDLNIREVLAKQSSHKFFLHLPALFTGLVFRQADKGRGRFGDDLLCRALDAFNAIYGSNE